MKKFEYILSGSAGLQGQVQAEDIKDAEEIIMAHIREITTDFTVKQLIIEDKGETNNE